MVSLFDIVRNALYDNFMLLCWAITNPCSSIMLLDYAYSLLLAFFNILVDYTAQKCVFTTCTGLSIFATSKNSFDNI